MWRGESVIIWGMGGGHVADWRLGRRGDRTSVGRPPVPTLSGNMGDNAEPGATGSAPFTRLDLDRSTREVTPGASACGVVRRESSARLRCHLFDSETDGGRRGAP